MMRSRVDRFRWLLLVVIGLVGVIVTSPLASAQSAGNAACPGEDVFFNPSHGEDIIVPPGYRVEVFASGLNFPTDIAFRGDGRKFEVFVTEAGTSLPGRCNAAVGYPTPDATNPFLPQVRVLDHNGNPLRVLGRPTSVAAREDAGFLHAPTIGIAFQRDFEGGRLFVTDSKQGVRGAAGPKNSSRVVELNPNSSTASVKELIVNLPTGDHPTEQITVRGNQLFWSQGSVTNSGVVGHDNTGPDGVGGPADVNGQFQHEIPCQDIVLSGNNLDSGDGHITGGFLNHGVPGASGQVVTAFTGATQVGMCSGAILTADLKDPQRTVRPVSWGYRNPFGIRFAPDDHPLRGALMVTENGEDERGARPANNSPDRLAVVPKKVTEQGLDFHGWPDRFGFLDSTQAIFTPIGGPADDNPAGPGSPVGKPVPPLLRFPPQPPVAPLAIEPADVAAVGLDFAPREFAGGGNPGSKVDKGDALVTREGDFGFSPGNGTPIIGHDIELVHFLKDGGISLERFAFNCRQTNQVMDPDGRKRCTMPANMAFVDEIRGINRPVDGKFGPDGAFYLVDFGAVRDFGRSTPASAFTNPADAPLVQIPATGVIWKISRTR
jgi:glucose/arabinose dehydrogenase